MAVLKRISEALKLLYRLAGSVVTRSVTYYLLNPRIVATGALKLLAVAFKFYVSLYTRMLHVAFVVAITTELKWLHSVF